MTTDTHNNRQVAHECGNGWTGIIDPLIEKITQLGGVVNQVKEKFGGLRVYFDQGDSLASEADWDAFEDQLELAQLEAERTCEMCGKPGRMMVKAGWHKTLCTEDALDLGYKD